MESRNRGNESVGKNPEDILRRYLNHATPFENKKLKDLRIRGRKIVNALDGPDVTRTQRERYWKALGKVVAEIVQEWTRIACTPTPRKKTGKQRGKKGRRRKK